MGTRKWEKAFADHQQALARFTDTVAELDDDSWERPYAAGKWSPAVITQHLVLYYEAGARALRGEIELRYRVGPVWRTVVRWLLLPHMLFHGTIPVRSKAPREVRPEGDPFPRSEALERLRAAVVEAEQAMRAVSGRRGVRVAHPYFGKISPLRFLRFSTVHMDHHRRQVELAGTAGTARRSADTRDAGRAAR